MFSDVGSILVVEDEPVDYLMLQKAFQRARFTGALARVGTAERAYRWLVERLDSKCGLPEIVFLDLNIPGESGLEMLKKLKSTPELANILIVVYSGSSNTRDMADARAFGADWYFVKKSTSKELDYVLSTVYQLYEDHKDDGHGH